MRLANVTAALILFPYPGAAQGDITVKDFFGDFDGASLVNLTSTGANAFSLEAQSNVKYGAQGSLGTWACAGIRPRTAAKKARSVRITVPNGNKLSDLRAVFSQDRRHWEPVPTQRSSFDFDVPLDSGSKEVYFATFYPYTLSQLEAHIARMAKAQYATIRTLGKTVHGRDIRVITITDPQSGDATKRRAFFIAGTHGAESASIYGVEGMLDFLVSDDPVAREMRRQVLWQIVPVLNVDAVVEGLDRRNAAGINLYYDWGYHDPQLVAKVKNSPKAPPDPSISIEDYSQPETRSAMETIRAFRPQVFLDVHSWHFAGDGYWGPEPAAESRPITDLKNEIAKYFKIQHWNHDQFPMASAATVAKELGIAATLTEFAQSFDSEKRLKTPDSMRAQGVQILRGTFEYLRQMR
jgi:hypothetical protein